MLIQKKRLCSIFIFPKCWGFGESQVPIGLWGIVLYPVQLITKNLVQKHKIKGHPFTKVGKISMISTKTIFLLNSLAAKE
jgi:ATP-dependent DNA helicase RecG